jgi:fibronectin type 3 domain-containing protein
LAAVETNGLVVLNWTASAGAASYNVYRSTTSGGEGSTPFQTGVSGTSFTDSTVSNGTTYYYTVIAVNATGQSGASTEVSTTPLNPGSLALAIDAGGTAVGSFAADGDYGSGTTTFGTKSAINTSGVTNAAPQAVYQTQRYGTTFTYTIPGLYPGAAYNVVLDFAETYLSSAGQRVFDVAINGTPVLTNFDVFAATGAKNKAIDEQFAATANNSGQIAIQFTSIKNNAMISGIAVYTAGSGPASAPAGPTAVTATQGDGQVALNWTAPAGAVSYNIYRSTTSDVAGSLYQTGVTGTSFIDSSVTDGTTYYYQVVAVFADGESGISNQVSATPLFPAIPVILTANPGDTQVTLTWTVSSDATSYNIYRSTSSGGEGATPYLTGVTNTFFTDTGLTDGTTYYYEVVAVNPGGQSVVSSEDFATPQLG